MYKLPYVEMCDFYATYDFNAFFLFQQVSNPRNATVNDLSALWENLKIVRLFSLLRMKVT